VYGNGKVRRIGEEDKSKGFEGRSEEERDIKTACVKKIDIARQLPKEVLEELSSKQ